MILIALGAYVAVGTLTYIADKTDNERLQMLSVYSMLALVPLLIYCFLQTTTE